MKKLEYLLLQQKVATSKRIQNFAKLLKSKSIVVSSSDDEDDVLTAKTVK